MTFIGIHLPAYLVDIGLSPYVGAWALSLVGIFNLVGTLIAGYYGNRFPKKNILSFIYLGRAITITVFITTPQTSFTALVFAATMGILWLATVPLTSAIVGQVFGPRYLGTLFGFVFFSHQLEVFLECGWAESCLILRSLMKWCGDLRGIRSGRCNIALADRRTPNPSLSTDIGSSIELNH